MKFHNVKEDTQVAQTGVEIKTLVDTRCSICRGKRIDKRTAINKALGKGLSWNEIESLTGVPSRTIGNHAQHLPAIFREAKEKGILEQPIDVHREFEEQLALAKELRTAAKEYLSDPETGKITLIPRSTEVSVIYDDYSDTTPKGEPKKKTDSLDTLLERAQSGNIEPKRTIIRHVDIRSFALDAIRTADATIDKFAKLAGEYQKDRENSDELAQLKKQIEKVAESQGTDYKTELSIFLQEYADKIKPDLKTQLISELNQ